MIKEELIHYYEMKLAEYNGAIGMIKNDFNSLEAKIAKTYAEIISKFIDDLKNLSNEPKVVRNNEDKKKDLCKCDNPESGYTASNYCWKCCKYIY